MFFQLRIRGISSMPSICEIHSTGKGITTRVASFLLASHNAEENGGWDPTDLWSVDAAIADDMLTVVRLIRYSHRYPDALGFWTRSRPCGAHGEGARLPR